MSEFQRSVNATKGYTTAFNKRHDEAVDSITAYIDDPAITTKNFTKRDFAKEDDYFDVLQDTCLKVIGLASAATAAIPKQPSTVRMYNNAKTNS